MRFQAFQILECMSSESPVELRMIHFTRKFLNDNGRREIPAKESVRRSISNPGPDCKARAPVEQLLRIGKDDFGQPLQQTQALFAARAAPVAVLPL